MSSAPNVQFRRMELKDHPKLREFWPPEPGGAFRPGTEFPLHGEDVLESVLYFSPVNRADANIVLRTRHANHIHTRDLLLNDAKFAEALAAFLKNQVGKEIREIGQLEVQF